MAKAMLRRSVPGHVVGDAEIEPFGLAGFEDVLRRLRHRALDAPAADRAGDAPGLGDGHAAAGRAG
jgi:hypothetical protein